MKPTVVIVDAANINERRTGQDWSFKVKRDGSRKYSRKAGDSAKGWLQIWSYDHFEDCIYHLENDVPGAVIVCFFDESSVAKFDRTSSPEDKKRLIEAWSRDDYKNGKIFKVPMEFKADHPLVELAQELDAFVITADRYDKPGDPGESNEWRKSERLFYSSFYRSQEWVFENQRAKDEKRKRLLKDEVSERSIPTEDEIVEILRYAENFLSDWLVDPRNAHLRREHSSENLTHTMSFELKDGVVSSEPEHVVRAYQILKVRDSEFRKHQRKKVKIQGRLTKIDSDFYIEWFANYSPIRIEPINESLFSEHLQNRNFVEVKGELNESSGHPVLKKASFVEDIKFEKLQIKIPESENLIKPFPKKYTYKKRVSRRLPEEPSSSKVAETRPTKPPPPPPPPVPVPMKSKSRLIKNLICIRRIFLLLILISLVVFSLSYSLEIMLNGREYVEGDTYSTPFTNILGSIIMVLTIIITWRWKPKKKP